jgi:hypothetical protein
MDLFGNPPSPPRPKNRVKGFAHDPGTGPSGERCGTCVHALRHVYHDRAYWKCELVRQSSGPGTDIRLKSPACWAWCRISA